MSQSLINAAGKRLFAQHMEEYRATDPLYEEYVDTRGKTKRRKRELPTGLSERDLKILRSVNRRAHYLDKGFNLCGLRFGWTFIIGIIPGAGDVADALLGYLLVIRKARKAELPPWLIQRMLFNLAVATSVGLVPIVGDVMLAMWRANSRNAALLEEYLRQRAHGTTEAVGVQGASKPAGKSAAKTKVHPETAKGKVVEAGPSTVVPAGPSTITGGDSPARSGSSGSRRWMNWGRSSKEKGVPQVAKRESRFVEDVDSSPPRL